MQPQQQQFQPQNSTNIQGEHTYPNQSYGGDPPQPIHQVSPKKVRSAKLPLIIGLVVTALLIIGCIVGWVVFEQDRSSDTGNVTPEVARLLTPGKSAPVPVDVVSSLGVKVPFNGYELSGFALSGGVAYTGSDLVTPRDYSVIRIRPVETSEATRSQLSLSPPNLRLTATSDAEYWSRIQSDDSLSELSKVDAVVEQTRVQRVESNSRLEVSSVSKQDLGGVEYSKISFTLKDESFGVVSSVREDCYVTVQSDRPYVACINNIRPSNFSLASQLERTLSDVEYSAPVQDSLVVGVSDGDNVALVGGEDEQELSIDEGQQAVADDIEIAKENEGVQSEKSSLGYLPSSSDEFASLAKLTPSVARVSTIYCADIKLTYPSSQQGVSLTRACSDIAGTGFFVSNDGLVATAASNVSIRPAEAITSYIVNASSSSLSIERLDRVLGYMVESRYIMQSDADGIKTGVQQGEAEAVAKVRALGDKINNGDIAVESETYSYALQLGDSPTVVNYSADGSMKFAYSDSVVSLKKLATDYDPNRSQADVFNGSDKSSDLALMRTEKTLNRPAVSISNGGFSSGAKVFVSGLPMYSGSNLESGQLSADPIHRFGEIKDVFDTDGSKVASALLTGHAGLRGAPAINSSGQVVGIMGYNNIACPESSCVTGSMLESANGIVGLARSKNLNLSASSPVVETWSRAIDEFMVGNYRESINLFKEVKISDPHNSLVAGFITYSESARDSEQDTSNVNLILMVIKAALVVLVIVLILLLIGLLSTKLFKRSTGGRGPRAPGSDLGGSGGSQQSTQSIQPTQYNQVGQYTQNPQASNQDGFNSANPVVQQVNDLYNLDGHSSQPTYPQSTQPTHPNQYQQAPSQNQDISRGSQPPYNQ